MSEGLILHLAYLRDVDIYRISNRRSRVNYHGVEGTVSAGSVYNNDVEVVILGEANRDDVYLVTPTEGKFHGKGNAEGILVPRRHLYLGDGRLPDLWHANELLFADFPRFEMQPYDERQVV